MNMEMSLTTRQCQTISQSQIQWLNLLALDNFELKQKMEKEYLENPLLEHVENGQRTLADNPGQIQKEDTKREMPACETGYLLEEAVTSQLPIGRYSGKEWDVIRYLTGNLEDSGFYLGSITEAAKANRVSENVVEDILGELKKLEPYGIFAQSLQECLVIQLDAQGDTDELKRLLITEHLEELAQGKISAVSRKLHVSTVRIRKCLSEISRLNPRPLNGFDAAQTTYIIPDVVLALDEEQKCFQARLNDDWSADYRISDYYYSMMSRAKDEELAAYFVKKYRHARFLIEGIEQRRATITSIADYIGKVQFGFLMGKEGKRPVTMTEAAKELGIAVSTVSRAVKGKYIQYPAGSMFFKDLFETGISGSEDALVRTREDIKEQIKRLIENEDKMNPLSDTQLVQELEKQQIGISRRTVAKYRDSMGIKGCFDRKCF